MKSEDLVTDTCQLGVYSLCGPEPLAHFEEESDMIKKLLGRKSHLPYLTHAVCQSLCSVLCM